MKKNRLKLAAIQMKSSYDKNANLKLALKLVNNALKQKADFIALPEIFNCRGKMDEVNSKAEDIPGFSVEPFTDLAKQKRVCILLGSLAERKKGSRRAYNTSILIDQTGAIKACYRKMHLFDVKVGRRTAQESKAICPGLKPVLTDVFGVKAGLSVCYDVRFPELYRRYAEQGARLLCVPAAFTKHTGQVHWETLLRARAIENLCYVIAPNQWGTDNRGITAYGASMIIDPWGKILAKARLNRTEIIYATLDTREQDQIRRNFPALYHRRIRAF